MKMFLILIAASLLLQGCMLGRNVRTAFLGPRYVYQPAVIVVQQPHYRH